MLISFKNTITNLSIKINGCSVNEVNEIKDLGIFFNSRLSFNEHISSVISKARQRVFLLRKCFSHTSSAILVRAFKTYVLPILEYCSPVWTPSTVTDIVRIESVLRLFTKQLVKDPSMSYSERLSCLNLISLEKRRLIADLVLLFKNLIVYNLIQSTSAVPFV